METVLFTLVYLLSNAFVNSLYQVFHLLRLQVTTLQILYFLFANGQQVLNLMMWMLLWNKTVDTQELCVCCAVGLILLVMQRTGHFYQCNFLILNQIMLNSLFLMAKNCTTLVNFVLFYCFLRRTACTIGDVLKCLRNENGRLIALTAIMVQFLLIT